MPKHIVLLRSLRHSALALTLALPLLLSCSSSDDDDDGAKGGATGGIVSATGGTFTSGSALGSGGASTTGGALGKGGTNAGGTDTAQGGRIPSGGFTSQAGIGGIPGAGPDGKSPYQRECRGETAMCVDVASLRCLGIRDGTAVAGYSCSNPCQTDADCSKVPSSAEAAPACIDFVTQKHCLLLCQQASKTFSCPTGMGCYVYAGSTTGYCLWQ
jgi:hypothetical protein